MRRFYRTLLYNLQETSYRKRDGVSQHLFNVQISLCIDRLIYYNEMRKAGLMMKFRKKKFPFPPECEKDAIFPEICENILTDFEEGS